MNHIALRLLLGLLFLLIAIFTNQGIAQGLKRNKLNDPFKSTQGFVGLFGGTSFSKPTMSQMHSDFNLIDPHNNDIISDAKEYGLRVENISSHFGISGSFSFGRNISVAISPAYKGLTFIYQSDFEWQSDEVETNSLSIEYTHLQRLHYISIPLMLRFSPIGRKLKPYFQLGVHYDRLINAQKLVSSSGIDQASGGQVSFSTDEQSNDISDLFIKSHLGLLGGLGITYNLGTILIFAESQYRYGMHNITDTKNRFSASRNLPGFGNVLDDISIQNLELSLGIYFPLKFLTKDFSPVIL